MFHVKHFGTIADLRKRTFSLGAARYEAGIWCKRESGVSFIFWPCFFILLASRSGV
jgi:hypothetical protein